MIKYVKDDNPYTPFVDFGWYCCCFDYDDEAAYEYVIEQYLSYLAS